MGSAVQGGDTKRTALTETEPVYIVVSRGKVVLRHKVDHAKDAHPPELEPRHRAQVAPERKMLSGEKKKPRQRQQASFAEVAGGTVLSAYNI